MKLSSRLSLLIVVLWSGVASAQTQATLPPFSSWGGGPFDLVNLGNLDVHFTIPVLHKAGRGIPFTYDISYDGLVWSPVTSSGVTQWQPATAFGWSNISNAGGGGYISYSVTTSGGSCPINPPYKYGTYTQVEYSGFVYHDPAGFSHQISATAYYITTTGCTSPPNGPQPTQAEESVASDGSGYTFYVGPATANSISGYVVTKSGTTINPPFVSGPPSGGSWSATDANGNMITESAGAWTDTLGTQVLALAGIAPSNTTLTYVAPSGANASYTVSYTNYTVQTWFQISGITEYGALSNPLVKTVTLPDGSSHSFTYEPTPSAANCTPKPGTSSCVTGRIASVTLPTGGTIAYTYSGGANGSGIFSDGSTGTLTRALSPGGSWTYARSQVSGSHWQTLIMDPSTPSNQTQIDFQAGSASFYETQRLVYQGSTSGTLLSTTITCYNGNSTNCTTTAISGGINERTIFKYFPNSSGQESETDIVYNSSGLVAGIYDYDYGAGHVGSLLRWVSILYGTANSSGGCSNLSGIVDHPCEVEVLTAPGSVTSNTYYSYDETTATAPTGATPQHTSVSGSRGNLTTLRTVVNSTTSLYRVFTNYDTGNVKTATDAGTTSSGGANVTTYNYPNATSTCGNAFPASISEPLSLSASFTWDCTGGAQTSVTDENGKTSTVYYTGTNFSKTADPNFWRPYATTDQLSTPTTFSYTATALESTMAFNSNHSVVDGRVNADGFGRPIVSQTEQGYNSTNYDSVETDYDVTGRPSKMAMPYVGTAGSLCSGTCQGTSTVYDGLGRPTLVTDGGGGTVSYFYTGNDVLQTVGPTQNFTKQFEYDGLGRLSSVCEITPGTSLWPGGTCAQTSPQIGYWTKYTYDSSSNLVGVTQNAQASSNLQTRTYAYDYLGRLTSETNPETGNSSSGSDITYTYDAACGSYAASAGDLAKRVDKAGNITCYGYDGLHRLKDAGNSGPTCRHFKYDAQTPPTGVTVTYTLARQAEAYTDNCSGTKITDEWFGYDADGRLTDFYESTPHSTGYYHTSASYWANGAIDSLSALTASSSAIFPTIYYGTSTGAGLDGEGRVTKVYAASGTNPVTSSTYVVSGTTEPIGALTAVTLGSADSDSFTYDPNTGRPATYTFAVNGVHDKGTLTWNANGTLGKLVIADSLTSTSDSQTCSYYYDDLARLGGKDANGYSVDCGTKWSQLFAFDPFGNISKSGTGAFLPTYSTATNQFTAIPGVSTPYYDSNGNLTKDNLNTYTWDPNWGNPASVNSTNLIYDASGQMVEQQNGSTYTQMLYSPAGKTAIMNGQTLIKAFVSLPGGGTAIYNPSSSNPVYYRHADWLGSSRLTSTASRTVYSDSAYAPYGEQYALYGTPDASFTDQNTDTTSTLYDFTFRELSQTQGRWISPDPTGLAAVNPGNPQSWNRYAYVVNNPLRNVDPLGLDYCTDIEGNVISDEDGGDNNINCADAGGTWNISSNTEGDSSDTLDPVETYISTINGVLWFNGQIKFETFGWGPSSDGCSVSVSCTGGGRVPTSFSHCTVNVGANGTYTAYDGGPTGSGVWSTLAVTSGQGSPPGNSTVFYSPVSCNQAKCVAGVADYINESPTLYVNAPPFYQNSNTAAKWMTQTCGMSVSFPSGAVGAH
jgi:RHS repeat-associated protein